VHDQDAERLLRDAQLWGLELDPRYRVLAVTFDRQARAEAPDDTRVQVLCHPVSTLLVSLRDGDRLLTLTDSQLVEVSAAFGGTVPQPPLFGRPEPRPGTWAPVLSLEGRSGAPDGRVRTLTVRVRDGARALDVFARFDELELRDPSGEPIEAPA
jgi:hypothetical protein